MAETRTIEIEVFRYNPETDREPRYQTYQVPFTDDMSVLQGLQYVKDHLDGSLTFRWSCRMAICGSCGKMVNGVPNLSCKTFLRDYYPKVRIEPLAHFPVERDLAVDQTRLPAQARVGQAVHRAQGEAERRRRRAPPDSGADAGVLQVLAVHQLPPLLRRLSAVRPQSVVHGPAALALLHRYNADSRDAGRAERMKLVNAEEGVWGCTLVGYCSEVCPKDVDPAHAINQNKVNSTLDYFLRFVMPRGGG